MMIQEKQFNRCVVYKRIIHSRNRHLYTQSSKSGHFPIIRISCAVMVFHIARKCSQNKNVNVMLYIAYIPIGHLSNNHHDIHDIEEGSYHLFSEDNVNIGEKKNC